MADNNETIDIVVLLENDPITGVKYGLQKITLQEDTTIQKHIDGYLSIKSRNKQLVEKNRTTQK